MNRTKLFIIGFGIMALTLVIATASYSQNLLNGVWFKITVSMKGYELSLPDESVAGKASTKTKAYLYTEYNASTGDYTVTTCTQDILDPNHWYPNETVVASDRAKGSGETQQIWDFAGDRLFFNDNHYWYHTFPLILFTIKENSNVSLNTIGCTGYFDNPGFLALSSCSLKGKSVSQDKVPGIALMSCEPF